MTGSVGKSGARRIGLTAGADLVERFPAAYTVPITLTAGTTEIAQNLRLACEIGL